MVSFTKSVALDLALRCSEVVLVSRCQCYMLEKESIDHVFLDRPMATMVWNHFTMKFGILDVIRSFVSNKFTS